jgi:hypothetical protein
LLLEPKLLHRLPLVQLLLDIWSILRAFCTAKFASALAAAFASKGALIGRASTAGILLLMLSLLLAKLLPTLYVTVAFSAAVATGNAAVSTAGIANENYFAVAGGAVVAATCGATVAAVGRASLAAGRDALTAGAATTAC